MIQRFTPCTAILPPAQQQLWPLLRPAPNLGFVLYGGTAIALHLGHRTSVDFDFFTDHPLDRAALETAFPFIKQSTMLQDQPDSITLLTPCGDSQIKTSFFGAINFGRVGEPQLTEDGVLQVAALDDLMATKLKTILQRVEAKDYTDIAAMIKAGVSLEKALASARQMFGKNFQPSESLKALVYFEGGDLDHLTEDEKTTLIKAASSVSNLPTVDVAAYQLAMIPAQLD